MENIHSNLMYEKKNHFAIRHITREEMTFLENEKQYASTRNIMHASVIVRTFMYYI